MSGALSVWVVRRGGEALEVRDGAIPPDAERVFFLGMGRLGGPDEPQLLVTGPGQAVSPRLDSATAEARVWSASREELGRASRWELVLCAGGEVLARGELSLPERAEPAPARDELPPVRVSRLEVVARSVQGNRLPADDLTASEVAELEVRGGLEGDAPPPPGLQLLVRIEDPLARSVERPVRVARRRTRFGLSADLGPPPFPPGDWTLSLVQPGRGVLRRVRFRLSVTALRVREARLIHLEGERAVPLEGGLDLRRLRGRLVLAYVIEGQPAGGQPFAHLTLRDRAGLLLGCWRQPVVQNEPAGPARAAFLLPVTGLSAAAGGLEARLALDGVEAHALSVPFERVRLRSDGVLVDPAPVEVDEAAVARGEAFFGIGRRRRRRRSPAGGDPEPSPEQVPPP